MTPLKRRDFIKQSAIAFALIASAYKSSTTINRAEKLSFSTLGCPEWDLPTILKFASDHGYHGIEFRGILGELDLTKCPDFSSDRIVSTKQMFTDKNLRIVDLGSSAQLHHTNKADLDKNLNEAKKFIDLAHELDCKYIRVFPEKLMPGDDRNKSLDTITKNLQLLGNYAEGSKVKVLIESHGDLVEMDDLFYVLNNSENRNVGIVWDIYNMWSVTKQSPTEVYKKLRKFIYHVHVKDAKLVNNKKQYVLLGMGNAPIKEAVHALQKNHYEGFYSLEWEKLWHPEIEEPEIALAQYPDEIKKYFKAKN